MNPLPRLVLNTPASRLSVLQLAVFWTSVLWLFALPAAAAEPALPAGLPDVLPAGLPIGWRVPVTGPVVVLRGFAPPPIGQPWQRGHRGVDLAAAAGEPIYASATGRVSFAGPLAGRSVVVVVHGLLRSTYEPVQPVVAVSDQVSAGQLIGYLQLLVGHCAQTCLHWGLLQGTVYLNPMVAAPVIRLLPFSSDAVSWAGLESIHLGSIATIHWWFGSG